MQYVEIALQIVGIASAIAAITPTKKDDKILGWVHKALNLLALNVGKAQNKE